MLCTTEEGGRRGGEMRGTGRESNKEGGSAATLKYSKRGTFCFLCLAGRENCACHKLVSDIARHIDETKSEHTSLLYLFAAMQ